MTTATKELKAMNVKESGNELMDGHAPDLFKTVKARKTT